MEHIKEEPRKPKVVRTYTCDICGAGCKHNQCMFCKRDICSKHTHYVELDCDLETPSYDSDYPDKMCHRCWYFGKSFREEIMVVRKDAEITEENIFKIWEKRCKEEWK